MSVIFGIRVAEHSVVDESTLLRLSGATVRYGVDGTQVLSRGQIGMGFQPFYTHNRSRLDQKPTVDRRGNILVFDGRLDNYKEIAAIEDVEVGGVSDSVLVLKSFERWGHDCFSRLVGDWALALWSAADRVLYLARDHAGARTLFYRNLSGEIRWSTHLETFFRDDSFPELDPEYIARMLASQPTLDLTPYKDIHAVPPAHYVAIRGSEAVSRPHWCWIADTSIVYRCEAEYDEQYRYLFRQSVKRRIVPGREPILAELSGGVDSSSIVCTADKIVMEENQHGDLIDTVSYFDDNERDWDERPYFTAVEKLRKKDGVHLDYSLRVPSYKPLVFSDRVYPYPGADSNSISHEQRFVDSVGGEKHRVVLSGTGGDELLGGVPAPMPELADYLRSGQMLRLISRASEWCTVHRQPLIHMLCDTLSFTKGLYATPRPNRDDIPPWLRSELRDVCFSARSYPDKA